MYILEPPVNTVPELQLHQDGSDTGQAFSLVLFTVFSPVPRTMPDKWLGLEK